MSYVFNSVGKSVWLIFKENQVKVFNFITVMSLLVPSVATANITDLLQAKSRAVGKSIVSEVRSKQVKQQSKLAIQLKIYALQNKLGAETDSKKRQLLESELSKLMKKKQKI